MSCLLSTFSPSLYAQVFTGDVCGTALQITGNGFHTTDGPATGNGCYNCGNADNADWYYFTPPTNGLVDVSVCGDPSDIDTRLWVYEGTCTNLTQVGSDDDGCTGTYESILIGLSVTGGATYYLEWDDRWSADAFTFEFTFTSVPSPANDLCSNAQLLTCGSNVSGNTVDATSTGNPIGVCGNTAPSAPGVWYSIIGTGADINLTLCSPNTGFDTKLHVYEYGCGSLNCVAGNDDASPACSYLLSGQNLLSDLTFTSTMGTEYHILVNGHQGETGNFELKVECASLSNDLCTDAIAITCGNTYPGSTTGASNTGQPSASCGTTPSAPGVWYAITGNGQEITLSTCNSNTNFDTKINVYKDGCGTMTCIGGNDDGINCTHMLNGSYRFSTYVFNSVIGEEYLALVNGFNGNTGDFDLDVTCSQAVCSTPAVTYNTLCNVTDNSNFYVDVVVSFGSGFSYTITNSLNSATAQVTVSGSTTQIGPFPNGSFVDVTVTDDGDATCFSTSMNLTDNCGGTTVINDVCADAIPITCGFSYTGSSAAATTTGDPSSHCGVEPDAPGVWYQITGNGFDITLSTCNANTDFDSQINVYEGSCGALACVGGNDDGLNCSYLLNGHYRLSTYTFTSVIGVEYFIMVNGFNNATGNFELNASCSNTAACQAVGNNYTTNLQITSARLVWAPVTGAHHYQIRGKRAGTTSWIYLNIAAGAPAYKNVAGLSANTSYVWEIITYCDAAETISSVWSATDTFTTLSNTAICVIPSSMWTTNITSNGAKFNWAPVSGAVVYQIAGRRVGASTWISLMINGNTTYKQVYGLQTGTSYEWKVRASCNSSNTNISDYTPLDVFTTASFSRLAGSSNSLYDVEGINVAPNPFDQQALITFPNPEKYPSKLIIRDLNGRVVLEKEHVTKGEIILRKGALTEGIYLLEIERRMGVLRGKLIVQ